MSISPPLSPLKTQNTWQKLHLWSFLTSDLVTEMSCLPNLAAGVSLFTGMPGAFLRGPLSLPDWTWKREQSGCTHSFTDIFFSKGVFNDLFTTCKLVLHNTKLHTEKLFNLNSEGFKVQEVLEHFHWVSLGKFEDFNLLLLYLLSITARDDLMGTFVKSVYESSCLHGNTVCLLLNFYNVILDYWLMCLRVTDLASCSGSGLCWLGFDRAYMRAWVREGWYRLRLSCRLCRRLGFRLQRCFLLLSSRKVGAKRDICGSVGSGTEVSIGAGWNISVWTWGYGSIWAGRVMELRAHRRTRDWGGRGAWCGATGHGCWWNYPLLVL